MASRKKATDPANGIRFTAPGANAPAHLLAEVEVPIPEGPLAGLKVTGIRVWRKKDDPGQVFVSFRPSRTRARGARRSSGSTSARATGRARPPRPCATGSSRPTRRATRR